MASVLIIHAPQDALPARALSEKLRQIGLAPVIEQQAGDAQRAAARDADAVMALWSPRSVTEEPLVQDAVFAHELGPVIHARMQNAPNPTPFAHEGSIDLTGWRGEDDFPGWRELAKAITRRVGLPEPAAPAPRAAASPFFQPGAPPRQPAPAQPAQPAAAQPAPPPRPRPQPKPRMSIAEEILSAPLAPIRKLEEPPRAADAAPLAGEDGPPSEYVRAPIEPRGEGGGGKLALIGAVTFIAVAALGLGGYLAWNQLSGGQSANAAWAQVDAGEPRDLQDYLNQHPGSSHDREAREALAELDAAAYRQAREADTVEAFEAYLADFPEGENALAARGRIAELHSIETVTTPDEEEIPIDPETGLPIEPADESADLDLAPPTITEEPTPEPEPAPSSGGPVPLAPPPAADEPAPQSLAPPPPMGPPL